MFQFLNKKHVKEELALVLTVSSDKVSSAIVTFSTLEAPIVYFEYSKHFHTHFDRLSPALVLSHVKEVCDHVLFSATQLECKDNLKDLKIYAFLDASLHDERIVEKTIKFEKDFVITQKLIDEQTDNLASEEPTLEILEKKITSLKANGYIIDNPIGRKVSSVDIKGFVTLSDKKFVEDLQDTIYTVFPNQPITLHTLTLAMQTVASQYLEAHEFILFIPEAHATSIVLVKDRVIENIIKIQFGKVSLSQMVAQELDTHLGEAHSLLALWFEHKLDEVKTETLKTIMDNARDRWHMLLKGAFSRLSKTTLLPQSIFFVDNSLNAHILGSWVTSEVYANQVLTINPFSVAFFSHDDLTSFLKCKEIVKPETLGTHIASAILYSRIS